MKVFCVITETDQGIDLSGVYGSLDSAVEHVKRRFHSESKRYIDAGYKMAEDVDYTAPSDYGAEIYLNPYDYWIWRIEDAEVRDECIVSEIRYEM